MLRVGLTGGLGSGKSTVARMFSAHGAHVFSSDSIGRDLMEPGQPVYAAIIAHFGPDVVLPDGRLDRHALGHIAFTDGRVEELNAIIHPAVIEHQAKLANEIFEREPNAVIVVESALILETKHGATKPSGEDHWRNRFDKLVLVTAPEEIKIARFVARSAGPDTTPEKQAELEDEARRRLAQQIPDDQKAALCDYVLTNEGSLQELEWQVDQLWPILQSLTA